MTPGQCRAGRAILGITQAEFAAKAGVGLCTLRFFETERTVPMKQNMAAMVGAFASLGVTITADGVRLSK